MDIQPIAGTNFSQQFDVIEQSHESFLRAVSWGIGWIYFLCWGLASYPQPIINFQRKSVTGLSVDVFWVAVLGHSCYTVSNSAFLFSETVRSQYRKRWGPEVGDPTVRINDLASGAHTLFWAIFTISQFYWWGYTRLPSQRLSRSIKYLILGCLGLIFTSVGLVLISPSEGSVSFESSYTGLWEWLDVIYLIGHIKLFVTVFKYYPQAYLNYVNKSTRGWAIHKCVLDFAGSVLSLIQLFIDSSLTPGGIASAFGNPTKLWLGCISAGFEMVFMFQHWVLYPAEKGKSKEYDIYDERRRHIQDDEESRGFIPDTSSQRGKDYGTMNSIPGSRCLNSSKGTS